MRAARRIQARIRNQQTLNRPPAEYVGFDDLVNIGGPDSAIPDRIGVDHDRRAMLALVQAARFVGAHTVLETEKGQLLLELELKLRLGGRVAAAARVSFGTLVAADKYVSLELWH